MVVLLGLRNSPVDLEALYEVKVLLLVSCQRTERCHRHNPGQRDVRLDVWSFCVWLGLVLLCHQSQSKTIMNRYGESGSPWRTPVLMLKLVVSPSGVNTTADVFTYIICMAFTIFSGMPYAWRIWNSVFLSTESQAFLKSMKIMAASFWWFLISSMMRLRARICENVDRRGLNPFWFGHKIFSSSGRILLSRSRL